MMARWTTPFCSGDSRQAGLLYLAAGYRNTTSLCSGASSANRILLSALLCVQLRLSSHFTCQPESWDRALRLRARREREKAHEDLVIAGFFALFQERLGMIGVFDICMPLVTADMAGNELVTSIETQTIGIRLQ